MEDKLKTNFKTKWGTYAYRKMPFNLINVWATFQRSMDIPFRGLLGKSVVVYLDDVIVFSKKMVEHIVHLKKFLTGVISTAFPLILRNLSFVLQKGNFSVL